VFLSVDQLFDPEAKRSAINTFMDFSESEGNAEYGKVALQ